MYLTEILNFLQPKALTRNTLILALNLPTEYVEDKLALY